MVPHAQVAKRHLIFVLLEAELAAELAAGDLEDNAFHLILEVAAMS